MKKEKTHEMRMIFLFLWLVFTILTTVCAILYITHVVDRLAYVVAPLLVSFLFYFGYKR